MMVMEELFPRLLFHLGFFRVFGRLHSLGLATIHLLLCSAFAPVNTYHITDFEAMFTPSLATLLALPALLRIALAQQTNSSSSSAAACNNSPSLCNRAYSDLTYLGAHDSPFLRDDETGWSTSGNQFFNTTTQLAAGVRLVSAQVQRANGSSGALHVCHTSCDLLDAGTLSSWLSEVRAWMETNPNDVVTVLLVNGAEADAAELASHYAAAGITAELAYAPNGDGFRTQQWPTLQTLVARGTRLVSFVAGLGADPAYPYLMDEFAYVFENDYDNSAPTDFSCDASRPGVAADDTARVLARGMLPLMNHFLYMDQAFGIQSPNQSYVGTTNAPGGGVGNLGDAATACTQAYGRAPSFVLVDFFNVGPAIETVDRLNGVTRPVGRRAVSTAIQQASFAPRIGASMLARAVCVVGLLGAVMS